MKGILNSIWQAEKKCLVKIAKLWRIPAKIFRQLYFNPSRKSPTGTASFCTFKYNRTKNINNDKSWQIFCANCEFIWAKDLAEICLAFKVFVRNLLTADWSLPYNSHAFPFFVRRNDSIKLRGHDLYNRIRSEFSSTAGSYLYVQQYITMLILKVCIF